jgi:hypothetical protein
MRAAGLSPAGGAARVPLVTDPKYARASPAAERLDRIEPSRDGSGAGDVPVTPQQEAELDRRIEEMDRDGEREMPWQELLERLRRRSR